MSLNQYIKFVFDFYTSITLQQTSNGWCWPWICLDSRHRTWYRSPDHQHPGWSSLAVTYKTATLLHYSMDIYDVLPLWVTAFQYWWTISLCGLIHLPHDHCPPGLRPAIHCCHLVLCLELYVSPWALCFIVYSCLASHFIHTQDLLTLLMRLIKTLDWWWFE